MNPMAVMLQEVMRLGDGEIRQIFIKIPTGGILQLSMVEDATWEGLHLYAADSPVALIDLSELGGTVAVKAD